jgi:hypothetical protein
MFMFLMVELKLIMDIFLHISKTTNVKQYTNIVASVQKIFYKVYRCMVFI